MEALVKLLELSAREIAEAAKPVMAVSLAQLNGSTPLDHEVSIRLSSASSDVRSKVQHAVERHGLRLWQCCLDTPEFDPWSKVPAGVREAVSSAGKGRAASAAPTETERRGKLAESYRGDALHIPLGELEPLRALYHPVLARWALVQLPGDAEQAFAEMREVLRQAADPGLREDLAGTLRSRIVHSGQRGDFNQVYLLSGFYAGEVGLPAVGDPFRDQLRTVLTAAADNFKQAEKMKRVFILSLISQCFPDEAAGRQAKTEAFAAAFDMVRARPAEPASGPLLPSTLPGYSVELVNNGTDHHLLMFYRGPELVAAHCWPWRRGTVVIPDGEYELAVLSPAKDIQPFHGKATFRGGLRISNFLIRSSRDRGSDPGVAAAVLGSGDYRLLHAPAALTGITVEPRSGLPRRTQP
jgi:hypothetical protein